MGHGVRSEGKPAGVRDRAAENWKRSEIKPGRDNVKATWKGDIPCCPKGRFGWLEHVAWKRLAWARQERTHGTRRGRTCSAGHQAATGLAVCTSWKAGPNRHGKAAKGGAAHSDTLRAEGRCPSLGSTLNPTGRIESSGFVLV